MYPSTYTCTPVPIHVPQYLYMYPSTYTCTPVPIHVPQYMYPSTYIHVLIHVFKYCHFYGVCFDFQ